MRTNKSSFGEKISNWKVIHTNLQPHLGEMQHLQPIGTELQTLIAQAEALDSEFELARQQKTVLATRRKQIVQQADKLRGRAAAHLRGSFGYTSEQLIGFGISPLKIVKRRSKKADPAKTAATQATT
jgi:hypothetical protein